MQQQCTPTPMNAYSAALNLRDLGTNGRAELFSAFGGKVRPADETPVDHADTRWVVEFQGISAEGADFPEAMDAWITKVIQHHEKARTWLDQIQELARDGDVHHSICEPEFSEEGRDPQAASWLWMVVLLPAGALFWIALHAAWLGLRSLF